MIDFCCLLLRFIVANLLEAIEIYDCLNWQLLLSIFAIAFDFVFAVAIVDADHDSVVNFIVVVEFILSVCFAHFIAEFDNIRIFYLKAIAKVFVEAFLIGDG